MVFSLAPETAIDPGTPAVLELGEFWATADAASTEQVPVSLFSRSQPTHPSVSVVRIVGPGLVDHSQ